MDFTLKFEKTVEQESFFRCVNAAGQEIEYGVSILAYKKDKLRYTVVAYSAGDSVDRLSPYGSMSDALNRISEITSIHEPKKLCADDGRPYSAVVTEAGVLYLSLTDLNDKVVHTFLLPAEGVDRLRIYLDKASSILNNSTKSRR